MTVQPAAALEDRLRDLESRALAELGQAGDTAAVDELRVRYLGRKGLVTRELQALAALPLDERRRLGELANRLKNDLARALEERAGELREASEVRLLEAERLDVALPGRYRRPGYRHPLGLALDELRTVFRDLGFSVEGGPEIETTYHNFTALNIPAGHPARDESDTIFIDVPHAEGAEGVPQEQASAERRLLLRTHTSPVQIRTMAARQPPLRIIAPGRCFRNDAPDATHSPFFYQIEGLAVGEGITFGHLRWTLEQFARAYFGDAVRIRFRPGYFPFVEPGAEVDVSCVFCDGAGCATCKQSGWLEILGAGMVHPAVFEAVGYDPERYSGFAFGTGVERMAMLKHGIPGIRLFYDNDLRFLAQFN